MPSAKTATFRRILKARTRAFYTGVLVICLLLAPVTGVFLFTREPTRAATNGTLNFQARLLSSTGSLVPDDTYNVQFNLYTAASGGSTQWTETYLNSATQGVTVKAGYFSVNLGSITSFPSTINWDQEQWLGMTVRGTGSCVFGSCSPADAEMTPRFKLTAVPYALSAGQLQNSSGGFTSKLVVATPTADRTITAPDASGTICLTTGNCVGVGGTGDILQGGNSFGAAMTIGTNDNYDLQFETNGVTRAYFNRSDQLVIGNSTGCAGSSNTVIGRGTLYVCAVGGNISTTLLQQDNDVALLTSSLGLRITGNNNAYSTLVVRGVASQSADIFKVETSAAASLFSVGATGAATFQNTTNSGMALRVLNAAGTNTTFNIDTTNNYVSASRTNGGNPSNINLGKSGNEYGSLNIQVNGAGYDAEYYAYGRQKFYSFGALLLNIDAETVGDQGVKVTPLNNTAVALKVRGVASQSGDLIQLQDSANNVNAAFSGSGAQLTLGRIAASGTVTQGILRLSDGTTSNFAATLQATTLTGNQSYTLPDATGTVCLTSGNCVGVGGSGDILNNGQNGTVRIGSNNANSTILESNGTDRLTIDSTGLATFAGSVILDVAQYLTLNGGNTASRPASPTEGMVYFDTTTDQLITYANGKWQADSNSAHIVIAAANASQASKDMADIVVNGDAGNGTTTIEGDQVEINSAISTLTTAGGGTVLLLEGTYDIDASIVMRSNVNLVGIGAATNITYAGTPNGFSMIVNSDTTNGDDNFSIQSLTVDGAGHSSAAQDIVLTSSSSTMNFVRLLNLDVINAGGSGSGRPMIVTGADSWVIANNQFRFAENGTIFTNVTNMRIYDNLFQNFTDNSRYGITATNMNYSTVNNNIFKDVTVAMYFASANGYNTFTGNTVANDNIAPNANYGVIVDSSATNVNNTISANTFNGGTSQAGVFVSTAALRTTVTGNSIYNYVYGIYNLAASTTITGNTVSASATGGTGVYSSGQYATITGNTVNNGLGIGVHVTGSNSVVSSNTIHANASEGIYVATGSDILISGNSLYNNTGSSALHSLHINSGTRIQVIGNNIIDTAGTGTAINVVTGTTNTYLADNVYNGTGATTITDAGTATRYASQLTASQILQSGSSLITANATSVITGSIDPAASTSVTGVGTLFTTQLQVGDRITVNAETRTVTVITSNTALTVDTAFTDTANDTSIDRLPASLKVASSAGTSQLVIADNGNVGIGTNAPAQLLNLAAEDPYIRFDMGVSGAYLGGLLFYAGGTNVATIGYNQGIVIGTTAANVGISAPAGYSVSIDISGSSANPTFGLSAASGLVYEDNNVNQLEVDETKAYFAPNVGIGDPTPDARLDVVGAADQIQLIVQANATQTANIIEVKNNSGFTTASFDNTGATFTLGNVIGSLGSLRLADGATYYSTIRPVVSSLTADRTITVPDASGELCLSIGNCAGIGGTGDILQNGNSFTAAMTIGTNDVYSLNLETSGVARLSIDSGGQTVLNAGSGNVLQLVRTGGPSNEANLAFSTNGTGVAQIRGIDGGGLRFTNTNAATEYGRFTAGGTLVVGSSGTPGTVEKLRVNTPTTVDNAAAVIFSSGSTTNKGLVVQGVAGQATDYFQVQSSDGSNALRVASSGVTWAQAISLTGTSASSSIFAVGSTPTVVNTILRGAGSQSAEMLQIQDSVANVNAAFGATGAQLTLGRIAASGTLTQGILRLSDGTTSNFGLSLQSATLTANRTATFPDATGTVCLTSGNCAGVGGTGDILNNGQNGTVRIGSNDGNSTILETNGTDRLTITSAGAATFSGTLAVTGVTTLSNDLYVGNGSSTSCQTLSGWPSGCNVQIGNYQSNNTATSNVQINFDSTIIANPTGASSGVYIGSYSSAQTATGNIQNLSDSLYGQYGYAVHNGSGELPGMYGSYNQVGNAGGGTATYAVGSYNNLDNYNTGSVLVDGRGTVNDLYNAVGTITNLKGVSNYLEAYDTGSITNATGTDNLIAITSSGTITNAIGLRVRTAVDTGAGSITNNAGIVVEEQSVATNNTNLLIGTSTIPTGQFSIYNSSTDANYFAGNLSVNNTTAPNTLSVNTATTADSVAQVLISTNGTGNKGLVVQGVASQTNSALEVQTSTGSRVFSVGTSGMLNAYRGSFGNSANGLGSAAVVELLAAGTAPGLLVRANTGLTGNLLQFEDLSSVVISGFNNAGNLFYTNGGFTATIQAASLTTNKTYTLPDATGTFCLTSGNCAGVGGTGDILNNGQNGTVRIGSNDASSTILETNGIDRLTVTSTGDALFSGTLDIAGNAAIGSTASVSANRLLVVSSDFTHTSGSRYGQDINVTASPGVASPSAILYGQAAKAYAEGANNFQLVNGSYLEGANNGTGLLSSAIGLTSWGGAYSGSVTNAYGLQGLGWNDGTGTITNLTGGYFANYNSNASGTVTNSRIVWVDNADDDQAIVNNAGIVVSEQNIGTNNTNLLIGTSTIPAGQFSIYNSSTDNNVFAGNLIVGNYAATDTAASPLHVSTTGTAELRLTAGSGSSWDAILAQDASSILTLNNGGSTRLTVEPAGNILVGTSDTTGSLFIVDTKTSAGDPTGVAGGIYYNSNSNLFRCYTTSWIDCAGGSSKFTDNGAYTYLNNTGDELVIGANTGQANAVKLSVASTNSTNNAITLNTRATLTNTAAVSNAYNTWFNTDINPASAVSTGVGYRGSQFSMYAQGAGNFNTDTYFGNLEVYTEIGNGTTDSVGTVSGLSVTGQMGTNMSVDTYRGIGIFNPTDNGTLNNAAGLVVNNFAAGANNTNLLIGQTGNASGNWSIYNSSTYNNLFGGSIVANNSATGTTRTTEAVARTNVTTVTTTVAGFTNGDIIFINNAGQDYYTRITAGGGTTTLTVSPAVSYDASVTVTLYQNMANIGATSTDYTTQTNRFFQGYFLGGVVTGAGSTTLSDQNLSSTGALVVSTAGTARLSINSAGESGFGTTGVTGRTLTVNGVISATAGNRLQLVSSGNTNLWNIDNNAGTLRIFREDYAASGTGANGAVRLSVTDAGNATIAGTLSVSNNSSDYLYHDGSYLRAQGDFRVTNTFLAESNVYTPILYDQNNAAFYLDPASTSILNDIRPSVMYDRDNTGYYSDPASTSRIGTVVSDDIQAVGSWMIRSYWDTDSGLVYVSDGIQRLQANGLDTITWSAGNYVAIGGGGGAASADLTVYGNTANCFIGTGTGTTSCTSDARLKNTIQSSTGDLAKIAQLNPVSYQWNSDASGTRRLGFVAQDTINIFPEVVSMQTDGYYTMDYGALVSPLVGAVKELKVITESLEARLQVIEAGQFSGNIRVAGNATLAGDLQVAGDTSVQQLTVNGKIITAGTAPTATVGVVSGALATIVVEGNDTAGKVAYTTGTQILPTSPVSFGAQVQATFASAYEKAPRIAVTPKNATAASVRYYIETTVTGFTLHFIDAPTESTAYEFDYIVIQ